MTEPACYVGLMSGTSIDAADAVAVRFDRARERPSVLASQATPPPADLREALAELTLPGATISPARLGELDQRTGEWFAEAACAVIEKAGLSRTDIAAIGSHGQTIWHEPEARLPFSLQLGSASRIAARTGTTVVADFRNADIAAGGQGAPLVPAFHRSLFADPDGHRVVVNIGGIANCTLLPARAATDARLVTGFDTGPGNGLMDAWIAAEQGKPYDRGGDWAAAGTIEPSLLERLLDDPYLRRRPPKSTGREHYHLDWLRARLEGAAIPSVDIQATLCEFTARTIVDAIDAHGPGEETVLVCGGGVYNRMLMRRLAAHLAPRTVASTAEYGLEPDWVEACAFAWLAKRRLEGRSGNAPGVTGARHPVSLGAIHRPDAIAES